MNSSQALEILIKAVIQANKRGAFELSESAIINDAVNFFVKKPEQTEKSDGTTEPTGTETSQSETQG